MELVPPVGVHSALLHGRLSDLDALTEHLDDLERVAFRSLLVGSVCSHVDQEQWEQAVATTIQRFNAWSAAEQQSDVSSNTDDPRI